jgi:hypothetical protein
MVETRTHVETFSLDLAKTAVQVSIFFIIGGITWVLFNEFVIASPEGFDPLRYEYYARYGLPQAFSDSSSYRMVLVLEAIYQYLPFYWGYLAFLASICFGLRYFDTQRKISLAIFSPVTFYYASQTGKDGIAILAIIGVAMLVGSPRSWGGMLFVAGVTILAFFVRPAIALLIPIAAVQFRFGTFWALMMCPPLLVTFSLNADLYEVLSNLGGLTGDEGAGGLALVLRQYTFGYELEPVFAKIGLLLVSMLFQPLLGIIKFYFGSPIFVILESLCFSAFLILAIKQNMLIKFFVSSLPYAVMIGATSPFYHFRYLAIAYPAIWAYSRYCAGFGWRRGSSVAANLKGPLIPRDQSPNGQNLDAVSATLQS